MPAVAFQQHKFQAGDRLPEIARRYGHGDPRAIWSFAANRSLVAKRRKPEALEPGDLLAIPPTARELSERKARLAALDKAIAAEWALDGALTTAGQRLVQQFGALSGVQLRLDQLAGQVDEAVEAMCKQLPACPDGMQAARRVLQTGAAVQAACKAGLAAVRAAAGKLAGLRIGLRAAITKDLVFGGTGELIRIDLEIVRHERSVADLLKRCGAPWEDLGRSAWWAEQAIALRDARDASPGATAEVLRASGSAAAQGAKAWSGLRRELEQAVTAVLSFQAALAMQQKMAEARRLQAGQQRAAAA